MAWVRVQKQDSKDIFLITDEVYHDIYELQGYKIVGNAQNQAAMTRNAVGSENIQPAAEQPSKRQYNKRSE